MQVYNRELIIGFYRSYFDGFTTFIRSENKFKVEYFPHLKEQHSPRFEHIEYALHTLRMRPPPLDIRYNNPYLVYEGFSFEEATHFVRK